MRPGPIGLQGRPPGTRYRGGSPIAYPSQYPYASGSGRRYTGQHWAEVGQAEPDEVLDLGETLIVRAPPSPYTLGIVAVAAVGLFWLFWGRR